ICDCGESAARPAQTAPPPRVSAPGLVPRRAALEPEPPALPGARVLRAIGVVVELERGRRGRAPRHGIERDERDVRGAGVTALPGSCPTSVGARNAISSNEAVTTGRREWRWATTAAAMSIQCMMVPPSTVP